jgi:very-short-patch-repair endonuclease
VGSIAPHNRRKPSTPPDRGAIARLATAQHGMIARWQLLAAGVAADTIDRWLRNGRLLRRHRGVYALGHQPPSPLANAMAAVLACGPAAVLSHRSAADLWAMARWTGPVEVTAPCYRNPPGIRVHRSRTLTAEDVTVHYGIPVTTPARTLLDLAATLDTASLTRAVNEARLNRHLNLEDLAALLARSPGRATNRLKPLVTHATGPTRSRFEDAFRSFIDRHGLPRPEANQRAAGHEVDALWREPRLVVELDGREYHDTEDAFEHDRDKDADLVAAGFRVVRLTWARLTQEPDREAARLRALVATGS